MADYPRLKSGAGAQYPLREAIRYETHVTRFVDGAEQRFRQHRVPVKEWEMDLSVLDEGEAQVYRRFFEQQSGQYGEFSYQDPRTGQVQVECRFLSDRCEITQADENKHALRLGVQSKV